MELRTLKESDAERAWQLDHDAFHTRADSREVYLRWFQPDRMLGLFDGQNLVAMTGAWELGQFFGRRRVPTGGVTSVAVAPEYRGRGLARRIMVELLETMRDRGEVFSSLYPATTYLYRQLGYEVAGAHVVRSVAPATLRSLPAPESGRIRAGIPDDLPAIRAAYQRLAPQINGYVDFPDQFWHSWRDGLGRFYVAESEAGQIDGFLNYSQFDGELTHAGGGPWGIRVEQMGTTTRDAALALWRLLGEWSSQVDQIVYRGAAEDPILLLLDEQQISVMAEVRWMSRAVDVVGSVAARGFSRAVEATVDLEIRDPVLRNNDGRFVLSVSKGTGQLEPGGDGTIELGIGAFSSLFTGWACTATLARTGLLTGGTDEQREALDAIFAGPAPWSPHEY
jgi:predicted acetyltransferase